MVGQVSAAAFLPRALPGTVFGVAEHVPGGFWVYQGGRPAAKVNVQTAGHTPEDIELDVCLGKMKLKKSAGADRMMVEMMNEEGGY